MNLEESEYQHLVQDIISLIEESKRNVVSYANSTLTILFWHIGKRILNHSLQNQRAEYGKQIVVTLSRQLSWSHFIAILPLKDIEAREFYGKMSANNNWGVRERIERKKIG